MKGKLIGLIAAAGLLASACSSSSKVAATTPSPTASATAGSSTTAAATSSASAPAASSAAPTTASSAGVSAPASSAAAVTNIKLAFLPSFQADYFTEEAKGAAAEAKKLGITINVQNPAGSAAAALTDLQTLVGTGTQGVLYVSPDSPSGASGFAIAKKANIPLIAADNNIDGAPFVGFQWASIATQVAKLDSQYLAAENWNPADTTAVSIELQTLDTCNQRTNAETATFKSASPTFAKSVVHVPYDGSINGSLTALGPVKTAHPSTKHWVLWSCNDEGVVGAIQALTAAGVNPSDIIGVGLGGGQACPLWNAGKTQSMRAVLYADPAKSGALGIQELYDFLANKTPIPASVALGATIVTPANYKTAMAGYVNC